MLGGRVKTLHPAIHAGLLARDTKVDRTRSWTPGAGLRSTWSLPIYTLLSKSLRSQIVQKHEAIEHIDIGGVALLRAGAKNFQRVAVLSQPEDYPNDLACLDDLDFRRKMAAKSFCSRQPAYDGAIQQVLFDTFDNRRQTH